MIDITTDSANEFFHGKALLKNMHRAALLTGWRCVNLFRWLYYRARAAAGKRPDFAIEGRYLLYAAVFFHFPSQA